MSHPGGYAAQEPDPAETGVGPAYGELEERSARLASHLREQGVRRGDVVALLADDDPRAFEVYRAATRSGLYVTTVNHLSAAEARNIVADSGAAVLIASRSQAGLAQAIVSRGVEARLRLAYGGVVVGFDSYGDAVAGASSEAHADQSDGWPTHA
jgi:fatty-acyl-CoA synthase